MGARERTPAGRKAPKDLPSKKPRKNSSKSPRRSAEPTLEESSQNCTSSKSIFDNVRRSTMLWVVWLCVFTYFGFSLTDVVKCVPDGSCRQPNVLRAYKESTFAGDRDQRVLLCRATCETSCDIEAGKLKPFVANSTVKFFLGYY